MPAPPVRSGSAGPRSVATGAMLTRLRAACQAADSSGTVRCAVPARRAWRSAPPRASGFVRSPVEEARTAGPVRKTSPAPSTMTSRSVSAGAYAAPPAAGPRTRPSWRVRPRARVSVARMRPTPASASTPSCTRAPPPSSRLMTGMVRLAAWSMSRATLRAPARPMVPPRTLGSCAHTATSRPSSRAQAVRTASSSTSWCRLSGSTSSATRSAALGR